jgi:hypothetical protein
MKSITGIFTLDKEAELNPKTDKSKRRGFKDLFKREKKAAAEKA